MEVKAKAKGKAKGKEIPTPDGVIAKSQKFGSIGVWDFLQARRTENLI